MHANSSDPPAESFRGFEQLNVAPPVGSEGAGVPKDEPLPSPLPLPLDGGPAGPDARCVCARE